MGNRRKYLLKQLILLRIIYTAKRMTLYLERNIFMERVSNQDFDLSFHLPLRILVRNVTL